MRSQDPRTNRAGDHLWHLQGPPSRSQAALVHSHHGRRRQHPRRVSLQRRQHQRFPHSHRDVEHTARRGGSGGLPLRRRFQAVFAREHGPYRSRRRPLRHRAAALSFGDEEFRQWIQTHTPDWTCVRDRPHPRHADGPRDRWFVYRPPLPSAEGWTVVWLWSTLLTLRQEARRKRNMAAASEKLTSLRERLAGPRTRLRRAADIDFHVKTILEKHHVARYLKVERTVREDHTFKQARRGRPGPNTSYRKITKRRFDIEWTIDQEAIAYDHKSDGMYPLITNDRTMSPAQVLEAHKGQPMIEKRFEQIKTVHEIAPVLLKNEGRIEALFTLYFLGLLVPAIMERELRLAMKRENIAELPIYPEQRDCARPTAEQILRLFSLAERHQLVQDGKVVQVFDVQFTELQRQVLALLDVPEDAFRLPR